MTYAALKVRSETALFPVVLCKHFPSAFALFVFLNICIYLSGDYFTNLMLLS